MEPDDKILDIHSTKFFGKRIGDTPTDDLQLVNKKYVDSKSAGYAGKVKDNGTSGFLPTGWTCVKNSSGDYTVTHNLGTSNYAVVINADGGSVASPYTVNSTVFSYQTITTGSALTDCNAWFIVIPQ